MSLNKANIEIGNFLKKSRFKNGLTPLRVARQLGVELDFIINIEEGRNSFSSIILIKLLAAYEIDYLEFNTFFNNFSVSTNTKKI